MAVIESAGKKHAQVTELMPIRSSALVGAEAPGLIRKLPVFDLFDRAGNDVDDRKKSVGAVQGGTGPANNLHPLDYVDIHQEFISHHGLAENVIVNAVSVNQHQNPAVPVPQTPKAAHAHESVIAVISDIEAGHTAQNVAQVAVTKLLDLVPCDHRDRSRRIAGALHVLGGAVNLDVGQFFQTGFTQVFACLLGYRTGGYDEHGKQANNAERPKPPPRRNTTERAG